jgi:hypothetical protein
MKFSVTAEFDSVDMADIASGRIRSIQGIINMEVLLNRYAAQKDDDSGAALPVIPTGAAWMNTGASPVGAFYPLAFIPGFDGHSSEKFEPARRRDVLLKIEAISEISAKQISSVLRNVGGRNVRVFQS